ncbi:MAG: 16S rRNA (cytosine(1402)-N(4))-methyltransferase RsmH [Dehalococcoidia bacterium]|nr:16S rRNA (cytosine(1402)-N(4))-methyltransferase RsmH [Dehalococcoidia bacterium]
MAAEPVAPHLRHFPVLLAEVVAALVKGPEGAFIDCTVGAGGHAAAILAAAGPDATLAGLDADQRALEIARDVLRHFGASVQLVHRNFRHLAQVAVTLGIRQAHGILIDLGLSTMQLAHHGRGFSLHDAQSLDMRFDEDGDGTPASVVVNEWPEEALADVIYRYGEEPAARRIARAIAAHRPITSAAHLAAITAAAAGKRGRIHPATRTLQAIRIEVNQELAVLTEVLPVAVSLLRPGGRLAVISFHSLEDRIVKTYFQAESRDCVCPPGLPVCACGHTAQVRLVGRKAVRPGDVEVRQNAASRSAKLRVVERL